MNAIKTLFIILFITVLSFGMSAQCNYSIVLYDTFGDGWNGGEVSISVNGTPVGTYTISTGGGPETHFFQVSTGNTIHATYTAGTWGYENEYYIYDSENNLIFSDGVGGIQPTANNTLVGTGTCPSCGMPGTLIATNISDVSANLSWVESGSATQWNIQWGTTGFTLGSGTIIPSTGTNPYPLSGLTSSTGYDFYVQADCGGGDTSMWAGPFTFYTAACPLANQCKYMLYLNDLGNSWNGAYIDVVQDGISLGTFTITGGGTHTDSVYLCQGSNVQLIWSSGMYDNETSFDMQTPWATSVFSWTSGGNPSVGVFHTFTAYCTPPTCPSPTNLGYANSTTTSADLSWQENGSATIWNIEYGPEGFTQGLGTFVSGVNTNPYTLNGLTIATAYDFYVQSDCGGGDTSFWSGPFTFHTASCLPVDQCVYSMFLGDNYGDGWNGASVTVEQDGVDIGNYTLATGDSITHFVSLCNGSNVSLIWNNGTFDTECYFQFYDPFSQLVTEFAAGTIPSAGPFFTFTVYCTPPTCPAPSALGASFITDQSASLSWQENGSATLWNIEYGPDGFVQGTGTVLSGVTTNPYVLNGLSSGTAYDFYVQSDCGGGDLSLWKGPYTFTTLIAPVSNPSACEVHIPIPDGGCLDLPVDVNGITGTQLGTDVYLSGVNLIIQHTADMDLDISLESPAGMIVSLSSYNGGMEDNYGIIDGSCSQYTNFNMTGINGSITAGTAPFLGSYIPEGIFDNFNDNSNPNGYWVLHICDNTMADAGHLEYVELIFNPILPPAEIIINELDCDQMGTDTLEFVELYAGGVGNYPLDGYAVVFYNGSTDQVYASYDLDGYFTNAEGYFLLANTDVPGVGLTFADNFLQNGADAVALYQDDASSIPIGTAITLTNLIDALVYETNDPIDVQLLALLNTGQPQIDEDGLGDKDMHSCSRIPNGTGGLRNTYTYKPAVPTPGAVNNDIPELVWDPLIFTEALVNNGSIANPVNLILHDNTFASTGAMTGGVDYNAVNVPAGLTLVITVLTDSTAVIELTGNAVSHLDIDDIGNLGVTFTDAAYGNVPSYYVSGNSNISLAVDFFDTAPKTIVWSQGTFDEDVANDGSIANTIGLQMYSETFTVSTGTLTESTHYSTANVPPGLTVEITVTDDSTAVVALTGNAISHDDADDVTDMDITFLDAAFTGGVAADVAGYSRSDLVVDFIDPYVTDIAISVMPDTLYACNNCICIAPTVYLENTGNMTIPQNDSIIIYYIYPPMVTPASDTVILSSDFAPGNIVTHYLYITISQTGIYDLQVFIDYPGDNEPLNDTSNTVISSYQLIVDLGGVNDTLTVTSYPYTLDAGSCTSPFSPCSFFWSTGSTSQMITVNTDGWYAVTLTDSYGCAAYDSVYVMLGIFIADHSSPEPGFVIFPNPCNGDFTVEIINPELSPVKIQLYDINGRLIDSKLSEGDIIIEQFRGMVLAPGMYYLRIEYSNLLDFEKIIIK